jgi:hypothetical protein
MRSRAVNDAMIKSLHHWVQMILSLRTKHHAPPLITPRRARNDMIESSDAAEPIENAEATDPIDPIESADPTDPIDSTDPREPIESSESSDQSDHFEPDRLATVSLDPSGIAAPIVSRREVRQG